MNRLPLPNWNCTPNINPTGNFSAILNVGYGGLPFTGQHYRSLPPHMFVPRPPVHTNVQESRSQVNENYLSFGILITLYEHAYDRGMCSNINLQTSTLKNTI